MMMVLLTNNLILKLILPMFQLDAQVLLGARCLRSSCLSRESSPFHACIYGCSTISILNIMTFLSFLQSQLLLMRRRAARGGRATPPLNSDDSNDEEGGAGAGDESRRPPGSGSGTPEENNRNGAGDSGSSGEHSGSGTTNRIQDSETMIVGNGETDNSGDLVGGANENGESLGNSALTKLTMDAYSSESDDD